MINGYDSRISKIPTKWTRQDPAKIQFGAWKSQILNTLLGCLVVHVPTNDYEPIKNVIDVQTEKLTYYHVLHATITVFTFQLRVKSLVQGLTQGLVIYY